MVLTTIFFAAAILTDKRSDVRMIADRLNNFFDIIIKNDWSRFVPCTRIMILRLAYKRNKRGTMFCLSFPGIAKRRLRDNSLPHASAYIVPGGANRNRLAPEDIDANTERFRLHYPRSLKFGDFGNG